MSKIKTSREIAEMLVERYLQANSVASVGGITATLNNWVSSMKIAAATKKSTCRCGALGSETLHTCPFEADVNNDSQYICNCCDKCEQDCADDI